MKLGVFLKNSSFSVSDSLAAWWWLRSANYNNNNNFCNVNTDGSANNNNARNASALSPGFCDARSNGSSQTTKDDLRKRRNTSLGENP